MVTFPQSDVDTEQSALAAFNRVTNQLVRQMTAVDDVRDDEMRLIHLVPTLLARITELKGQVNDLAIEEWRYKSIYFAPTGDNHHNAAVCPYCTPGGAEARKTGQRDWERKAEALMREIQAKLTEALER